MAVGATERGGEDLERAAAEFGKRFADGFAGSVKQAGLGADAVSDQLTAAAIRMGGAFLAAVNENAARGDSATKDALIQTMKQVRALERIGEDCDE